MATVPRERLVAASDLVEWLGTTVYGVPFIGTEKTRAGAACFAIVLEHHRAMVVLADQEIYASTFALLRIAFEGYVRGVWLATCATDEQISKFVRGGEPPPLKKMLAAIESTTMFDVGILSAIKSKNWDMMCDFTHTGGWQVRRWNSGNAIESNYRPKDVVNALDMAALVAMMSAVSIGLLVDDMALSLAALDKVQAWKDELERRDGEQTGDTGKT